MTTIHADSQNAGANEDESHGGQERAADTARDIADDLAELRTQMVALLAKLDADIAAGGASEVDYESTLTPAPLKTIKG